MRVVDAARLRRELLELSRDHCRPFVDRRAVAEVALARAPEGP